MGLLHDVTRIVVDRLDPAPDPCDGRSQGGGGAWGGRASDADAILDAIGA